MIVSNELLSVLASFAGSPMLQSLNGDSGSAGERILTVFEGHHAGQNYRIAKEILHNRDGAWMSEYILNLE